MENVLLMVKNTMEISNYEAYKRLRKSWKKNPGTVVQKDKRKKSRQQEKIELKKEIE